jgi:hypothetical protein
MSAPSPGGVGMSPLTKVTPPTTPPVTGFFSIMAQLALGLGSSSGDELHGREY